MKSPLSPDIRQAQFGQMWAVRAARLRKSKGGPGRRGSRAGRFVLAVATAGCLALAAAPAVLAEAGSGIDQYLERVPTGSGDKDSGDFAKELGENSGTIDRAAVDRMVNASDRRDTRSKRDSQGTRGGKTAGDYEPGIKASQPAASSAVLASAKNGAISAWFLLLLIAVLGAIAAAGWSLAIRRGGPA